MAFCCGAAQVDPAYPPSEYPSPRVQGTKPAASGFFSSRFTVKNAIKTQLQAAQSRVADLEHELLSLRPLRPVCEVTQAAVASAKDAVGKSDPMPPSTAAAAAGKIDWSIQLWLESQTAISEIIAEALLRPLQEAGAGEQQPEIAQLAFIRELGRADTKQAGQEAVLRMLRDGPLLSKLAERLWLSASELANARAATVNELCGKFRDEAAFTLAYGGLDTFFGGLERLLGPPSAQLAEAMRREHCASEDSKEIFLSDNYGVRTTSNIEWEFVRNPEGEDTLRKLGITAWPHEEKLQEASEAYRAASASAIAANAKSEASSVSAEESDGGGGGGPVHPLADADGGDDDVSSELAASDDPATRMREPFSLSYFEAQWAGIDERLEDLDMDPVQEVEVVGARLYTGPLYVKYNAALRAEGGPFLEKRWRWLCQGNRYTTTLHVINSAVVKLSKLQNACKVYRGISGGMLPEQFWAEDEAGVRGGCEFGFLSTTTDAAVATEYAASGGKAGIVFEISMGMIDRGASLSWLSQYPHEEEILFAPLTGVELRSARVNGSVLMVEVRTSVNLTNRTIEEVVAKMQSSACAYTGVERLEREDQYPSLPLIAPDAPPWNPRAPDVPFAGISTSWCRRLARRAAP